MAKITFYPLGNADCSLIKTDMGKLFAFDYADMYNPEDRYDRRMALRANFKEDIGWPGNKLIDVLAVTHGDNDHVRKISETFWLQHAVKYQDAERIKFTDLWVPAALLVEEGADDDTRVVRQEARHRFWNKSGIRVFARPEHLKEWVEEQGKNFDDYKHLITGAGQIVPNVGLDTHGIEFFVHSPFAERLESGLLDRNDNCLVMQATIRSGGRDTRFLITADSVSECWGKIVTITRAHGNDHRLIWDLFKIPHHCSYLSMADEKGDYKTKPSPEFEWLLSQGATRSIMVSTSWEIPIETTDQPPHVQTYRRYKETADALDADLIVTMEHPTKHNPKRVIIEVGGNGVTLKQEISTTRRCSLYDPIAARRMSEVRYLAAEGTKIAIAALRVPKATQFAAYLRKRYAETGTTLLETRRRSDSAEVVVFEVRPERPQDLVYDIRRVERLAVVFHAADDFVPGLFALRSDFPLAPHVNQTNREFPRSLCLYDEAYEEVRLKWTPANFLKRAHFWLTQTAKGTLHAKDQPLEPLILAARDHVILPANFLRSLADRDRLLHIVSGYEHEGETTYIAKWVTPDGKQPINVAVPVVLKPQVHGIIRHAPQTLFDLNAFCQVGGVDLARLLANRIRGWLVNKPFPQILDTVLFLVLVLPKTRTPGEKAETYELRGFLTASTVQEVGATLGAIDKKGSSAAYVIGDPKMNADLSKKIEVGAVQVHLELEPKSAAAMNGIGFNDVRAVAIGSGAIGSQMLNNFVRAGFGTWTIIEPDVFLPHNAARHLLPARAVGLGKAQATAGTLDNTIFNGSAIDAIPASIITPGKHKTRVEAALAAAKLIYDFSASVAVSRFLAGSDAKARHISAFLTPSGGGLVVAVEDSKRKIRLDWLEMLHYRAIIGESVLNQSLQSPEARVRYGNSCRDLSAQLSQDDVAIWAGMASKVTRRLSQSTKAAVEIYSFTETGIHPAICPPLSKVRSIRHGDWTIRIDDWLVAKLSQFRTAKLPNETGGILLGHFDTHSRICSMVDAIPSPPDSGEWPTSYIRGVEGLKARIANAETLTLGQIGYVGEWHSHPRGCPARPSCDDLTAYAWLCDYMNAEALPGVMLIVADRKTFHFVGSQ